MGRVPVEINEYLLIQKLDKLDTQQEVADFFGCSQATISNKIKELNLDFIANIIKARKKYYSHTDVARSLGMTVEQLHEHLKNYGLIKELNCITPYDPKKELNFFSNFDDVVKKAEELEESYTDSIGYDEVEFELPERACLFFLTDPHVGNPHTRHKKITKTVDLISKKPNTYGIGGGDYCDNFENKRPGSYDQVLSIPQQKDFIKQIFERLRGKMLAVVQGCHDEWMYNREEFDLSQYLSKHSQGKPLGFGGVLKIHIGEQTYKILVRHKISGFTPNSSPTSLMKYLLRNNLADIDLILTGHWHTYVKYGFNIKNRIVNALIYPSYKRTDRWIDAKSLPKSPTNVPLIILGKKKHEVLIFDNIEEGLNYL
ncbi:MAG: hypothetical protein ACFE96_17000 [Candidatus Hermodarchaeota archaeon]